MKQTLQRLFRKFVAIMLGILLGIVLLIVLVLAIPDARNIIVQSWFQPHMVHWYNRLRPRLNIQNTDWCLEKLSKTGAQFTSVDDSVESNIGCALDHVVSMSQAYITYNRQTLMTCALASAMYTFEKKIVQPQAQKYFKQPVVKIVHVGTYNCRSMRGSSTLLSEHAYANAIDITAFQLQDGSVVSIKRDWHDSGNSGTFLHAVAQKACGTFRKVLTPNYNALHHDHFHLDQGFVKRCGY